MRECRMAHGVAQHVHWFGAVQARFQVEKPSVLAAAIGGRIADAADGPVGRMLRRGWTFLETCLEPVKSVDLDAHAKADPYLAQRIAKIGERVVRVAARVTDDDYTTAPPYHLVDSKVVEMAAV